MNTLSIFSALKDAIQHACQSRDFGGVLRIAESTGMRGGEDKRSITILRYEYKFSDSDGNSVELSFRSYDPSGPFQMEPDINRFNLTLTVDGRQAGQYSDSYID
ncbi:hypothetical protein [Pseudomonas azerbaijanoccidentalis]